MKIKIYGHLMHHDYPWSVGKLKVVKSLDTSDEALAMAETAAAKARQRRDTNPSKRLVIIWRLAP